MNILFVVPYVPNKIRVRPYSLIRYLAQLGHQITVLTIWTSEDERQTLEDLEGYCAQIKAVNLPTWRSFINCLLALPSSQPLQAVYSWDPNLAEDIYSLAAQTNGSGAYDIVHVEHLRGARYGIDLNSRLSERKPPLPIVWDSVDSISLLFRQAMVQSKSMFSRGLTRFELSRTERYESWLLDQFDQVLVTSQNDKNAFLSLSEGDRNEPGVEVLPNGVDLGYFTPDEGINRKDRDIVLSGKMSYHANLTMVMGFVQDIMPLVWEKYADVQVWIVGKDPPQSLQVLADNPNIHVTGTVVDIRPYLQMATLSASPITYGAGIQNKVLEAMACATPVIATPQAVSALGVKAGEEVVVASDANSFAENVIALLEEPERREKIGKAGRKFVERNHDWAVIAARLGDVYSQAIDRRSTAG
jgi:sugar transferase (PEP-CTERM/EpsH1 system associated)